MTTIWDVINHGSYRAGISNGNTGACVRITEASYNANGNTIDFYWQAGVYYTWKNWQYNYTGTVIWEDSYGNSGNCTNGSDLSGGLYVYDDVAADKDDWNHGSWDYWTRPENGISRSARIGFRINAGVGSNTAWTDWFEIPPKGPSIIPDTFVAQSQWDIVYCPMGGTYSGVTQTKIKDTNLLLNSEIPVRKGFTFNGWNTALDGSGTPYSPGNSYTQNEPLMLFAQWTKNISLDSLRYVSWPRFKNFVTSVKSKLKPDNLSAYVIKEGIFKTARENATTTGTNVDWWWQYRHWSDGIAEAWGYGLGQSSTSNTVTSLYTALPKDIFVDHPITTMSVQLNGIYGVWPTHVNAHTYTSSETSDPDAVGITWIDNYINHDMDNQGKGKNYWVRYYLRGRWAYKATITNDTSITDNGTYNYVKYNNTKYFTPGASFIFKPGETLTLRSLSIGTGNAGSLYVDGTQISSDTEEQTWTLPFKDVSIKITITGNAGSRIDITTL